MKHTILFFIILISTLCHSQTSVEEDWTLNFPTLFDFNKLYIVDMEKDNAGNIYITGNVLDNIEDNSDIITFKIIMSSGIVEWVAVYNGPANRDDKPTDLETDDQGNCFVAASRVNENNTDHIIIKYSSSGQKQLEVEPPNLINDLFVDNSGNIYITGYATIKYDSIGNMEWNVSHASSWGIGMTVDDSGNVYIAGTLDNADFLTIKYNQDGQEQWARSYNDLQDRAFYIALDNEGNIYSAGANVGGNTGDFGFFVFKYDQQGNLLWHKKYSTVWAQIYGFAVSPLGNIYISGSGYPVYPGDRDYITVKYNSGGTLQWAKYFNGSSDMNDVANDLLIDLNENVYVTGYSSSTNQSNAVTIKYNSSGDSLWTNSFGNSNLNANGRKILLDGSNDPYIGLSTSSTNGYLPSVMKLNTNGIQQWVSDFKGFSQPTAIKEDFKGNIYIAGFGGLNQSMCDYITMKCDSSGSIKWIRTYNGPANEIDQANDIKLDTEGNVYVTGGSKGIGTDFDYATIKYDSSGNEQWVVRYNGPAFESDIAGHVSIDADGNVYVSGSSLGTNSSYDIATVKYNNLGQLQWVKRYNGTANGNDLSQGLEVDFVGNIFVAGTSDSTGSLNDYVTIKYNPSGNTEWVKRYNGPANDGDLVSSMSLDNSGDVYVTGWSFGNGTQSDYATVKYNTSGAEQWAARWDDPASSYDYANDIAVDEDENVYVTGISQGMGTDNDYTTVKYNSLGEQQWAVPYNGQTNGSDIASHIALDYLGDIYVAGYSNNNTEYATIKYNKEGVLQWNESYNFEDYLSTPTDLIVDNSGNVIVAGYSSKAGEEWIWSIVKYKQPGFIPLDVKDDVKPPLEFALYQNYPNPFNPVTTIKYQIPQSGTVTIKVYDVLGKEIATLANEEKSAGSYEVKFDASRLSSGVYFYKIRAGEYISVRKMILLR